MSALAKGQQQGSSALRCAGATCVTAIKHETKINFPASLRTDRAVTPAEKNDATWYAFVTPLVVLPNPAAVFSLLSPYKTSLLCLYIVFEVTCQ